MKQTSQPREDLRQRRTRKLLADALLSLLEAQGVKNVCAVITIPNDRSIGFHQAMGFSSGGVLPYFGYKLGQWHSVAYLYRRLDTDGGTPAPLLPIHALDAGTVSGILTESAGIS